MAATVLLYVCASVAGYLIGGWNPAITLSRIIYGKDIRECGSGNPGFTNFKRVFGNRWAWWVLVLDLLKAALVVGFFAWLFAEGGHNFQVGAAYTGMFVMLGHAFPVYYNFKGGKGFLALMVILWFIDWRAGLIALLLMLLILVITWYMSVATVSAMLLAIIPLILFHAHPAAIVMYSACALFMTVRHWENFKRLRAGTESKFSLKSHKKEN